MGKWVCNHKDISRGRAVVARKAHNLEVGGSIPSLATKNRLTTLVVKSRFPIFFKKDLTN